MIRKMTIKLTLKIIIHKYTLQVEATIFDIVLCLIYLDQNLKNQVIFLTSLAHSDVMLKPYCTQVYIIEKNMQEMY